MLTKRASYYSELLGWAGVLLILCSYGLLSLDIIDGQSIPYHSLVLSGSLLVATISYKKHNFQPMVLNIFFALFATIALIRVAFL